VSSGSAEGDPVLRVDRVSDAPAHRPGRGERSGRCGDPPTPRLRRGIEQFNRGEFFEQHETLELEWLQERDPVRYLYQGILQIGIGFEHLRRGNPRGARQLWRRGISYLEPFESGCMNVDVDRLVADTERCIAELERVGDKLERFDHSLVARVQWLGEQGEGVPVRGLRP
jgi:predicted metal-dependent hydrolase